jgi:hypothetical protein
MGIQEDLFTTSKSQELRNRVKELDGLISRALKRNEYECARTLTEQQEKLIHELVVMSEEDVQERESPKDVTVS